MKKYLALFAVLFAVILSSCSNDDIPVSQNIAFKVDPSTVISSYEEFNVGDLTSLGSNYQLRIRLLVYNEDGILVASDEAFSQDYTHIQNFNFNLEKGNYTTVAITDVVGKDGAGVTEFYTLSSEQRLNTTTVTYNNYIGGALAILGLTSEMQYIDSNTRDITINVHPAGALIVFYIQNWNSCLDYVSNGIPIDIETYKLLGNQASSDLTLDSYGNPNYSIKSSSDYDYIWYMHNRDSSYAGGYGYGFKFPMNNVKLQWYAETSSSRFIWGDGAVVNIEAGKEYYFVLDVAEDEAGWYDLGISTKSVCNFNNIDRDRAVLMSDFTHSLGNEPMGVKAISYLKQK